MMSVDPACVVRRFAVAACKLVRNPSWPAYRRYYDFLGAVVGFQGDLVEILVYGPIQLEDVEWWALRRKTRAERAGSGVHLLGD